jgi:hypothetical protein
MQIRPTLVIGIGGSGTWVVRRLKKRLNRSVGAVIPPALQLLALDTDDQQESTELSILERNEFYLLNNFLADAVVSSHVLAQQPNVQRWWRYEQLLPGFIKDGAQQRPPVGRLALFYYSKRVWGAVQTAIRSMFIPTPDYQPIETNAIDIYVVGSSCGGTGAGMFFDIVAMAKEAVIRSGCDPLTNACIFLPSCFHGTVSNEAGLHANAHLFLRSLENLQREEWPPTLYGMTANDTFQVGPHAKPLLKRVHLISAVDVHGVISELQAIFEKVALLIDLEVTSAAARAFQSALVNVPPNWTSTSEGKLMGYSSFGVAQLAAASDYTKLTLLPQVGDRVLRALLSPATNGADHGVLRRNESFTRFENLLTNDNAALDEAPGYEYERKKLETASSKGEVQSVVGKVDSLINSVAIDWVSGLTGLEKEIESAWTTAFNTGVGGHSLAQATLKEIERELSAIVARAKDVRATERENADRITQKVDGMFVGKKTIQAVITGYVLPYLRDQTVLGIRQKIANAALPHLETLQNSVKEKLRALQEFAESADAVARDLRSASQKKLQAITEEVGAGSLAIGAPSIATATRQRQDALVDAALAQAKEDGTLARLAKHINAGASARTDVASALWNLVDTSVSHELAQDAPVPEDWVAKAGKTIATCQPMVKLQDPASFPREAVVRVFRSKEVADLLAIQHPGLKTVCTDSNEPGQLDAMTAVLNFPLFQLQELRDIDTGYRQFRKIKSERIENRCALRNKQLWQHISEIELQPLSPEQKALARALAEVTGRVRRIAQDYIIDGEPLGTDADSTFYERRRDLDSHLVSRGISNRVLSEWRRKEAQEAKRLMQEALEASRTILAEAKARAEPPDEDWDYYIDMLTNELEAVHTTMRRI